MRAFRLGKCKNAPMWGVSEAVRDMDVPNGGTQSISHRGVTRLQGVAKNGYDMTSRKYFCPLGRAIPTLAGCLSHPNLALVASL